MVAVHIYIEGGGSSRHEQRALREGFHKLLGKLPELKARPKLIACGGRKAAFDEFRHALKKHKDALCILLVDSEGPVRRDAPTWDHVREREGDRWERPDGVADKQLQLMVQAMEAWLIADPEALKAYYGQRFHENALPGEKDVELIPKRDLEAALKHAARDTTKGRYDKWHGWELIGLVDPRKVRSASWHAARFFDALRDHLG